MRHSQTGTNNRLALRIGDTWYMSEESVSYTATGECQKAIFMDLEDAIFGATPEVTSCTTPPCGPFKPESFDTLLPDTGTVDAFGIFIDGTGANHRFDNYTIALNPSSFRNLGQCISTFIEVSCSGLTGRQRATCVQVQQEACRAAF